MSQIIFFALSLTFDAIVVGAGIYLRSYLAEKGKSLATKEDIGEVTTIVEAIKTQNQLLIENTKPFTAEETLRRETLLKAKIDAYYNAFQIVCRRFASNDVFTADDTTSFLLPASTETRPTEQEINDAFGRLVLHGGSRAILDKYMRLHQNISPAEIGDFLGLLRADVGGESLIPGEEFPYMLGSERKRTRKDDPERKPI